MCESQKVYRAWVCLRKRRGREDLSGGEEELDTEKEMHGKGCPVRLQVGLLPKGVVPNE